MNDKIILEYTMDSRLESIELQDGKKYVIGRPVAGEHVDIPVEMNSNYVAKENTLLFVRNGIPYVGNRISSDSIGTWLNEEHLKNLADPENIDDGWYELNNGDEISIGHYGRDYKFQITCPERALTMDSIRRKLRLELANPTCRRPRRPKDILKGARILPDTVYNSVADFILSRKVFEFSCAHFAETEEDKLDQSIPQGHIKFTNLHETTDQDTIKRMVDTYNMELKLIEGHVKFKECRESEEEYVYEKKIPRKKWEMQEEYKAEEPETVSELSMKKSYDEDFYYKTLKIIKPGQIASISLVEDSMGEKLICKKFILKDPTPVQLAKYRREAELGMILDHPNLVKTCKFQTDGDIFSIFMEYCEEGSVSDMLKKYCYLDIDDAVDIILQVLDGLDYMHNVKIKQPDQNGNMKEVIGVVHRDIKPANMLLHRENGRMIVKLSDFGLSKAFMLSGYSGMTRGEAVGTYNYISKKQCSANYKYAGPSEDVFSVAASFYEMLSGRPCRDFESFDFPILAIKKGNRVPLKEANSSIPQNLADVIDSVLAEEELGIDEKYTTAAQLKEKIIYALNEREL